jgi:hypothetical protein
MSGSFDRSGERISYSQLANDLQHSAQENAPQQLLERLQKVCPSVFIRVGPFEVRPGMNQEVPIGRAYQPISASSVSRLQGFIGRDRHSLYIREVQHNPRLGLRPSKNGIWVRQWGAERFYRLAPGEAVRIYSNSEVRVGGNGTEGATGLQIEIQ